MKPLHYDLNTEAGRKRWLDAVARFGRYVGMRGGRPHIDHGGFVCYAINPLGPDTIVAIALSDIKEQHDEIQRLRLVAGIVPDNYRHQEEAEKPAATEGE